MAGILFNVAELFEQIVNIFSNRSEMGKREKNLSILVFSCRIYFPLSGFIKKIEVPEKPLTQISLCIMLEWEMERRKKV